LCSARNTMTFPFPALLGLCTLLLSTLSRQASGFSTKYGQVVNKLQPAFEIDVAKAYAESTFPFPPEQLIEKTKSLFSPEIGLGLKDGGDCLADDFQFTAAVVGPLGKEEFLGALSSFRLEDSFTIQQNAFGFVVSPVQTNRVYFITNNVAQLVDTFMGVKPQDFRESLILPPQCVHVDFDENMKVKEFGFYTVDRQYGNTGGLGGAFGFFYGVGKPLPFREAQPFKRSFRFRLINALGRVANSISKRKAQ
jgi:hypothetical protein